MKLSRVFACLGFATLAPAAAQANIRLRLMYNQDLTLALATVASASEIDFLLNGTDVDVYSMSSEGGTLIARRSTGSGYYYGPVAVRAAFKSGIMDMTGTYASHVVHMRILTNGKSTCRASISNTLRPGHTKYEYELPVYGSVNVYRIRMYNVRCELSTY